MAKIPNAHGVEAAAIPIRLLLIRLPRWHQLTHCQSRLKRHLPVNLCPDTWSTDLALQLTTGRQHGIPDLLRSQPAWHKYRIGLIVRILLSEIGHIRMRSAPAPGIARQDELAELLD